MKDTHITMKMGKTVDPINWEERWKNRLRSTHRTDLVSYWDKHAQGFNKNTALMQELTQKQLESLPLHPSYSLLDVGAGNGRLTIPIAKQVKQVTAIEPSVNMVTLLKSNAEKEGIQNLVYVNRSLEDVVMGEDVQVHDVTVSSFSLCMMDIVTVLRKMDALASKQVYLFVYTSNWLDKELQKIIHGNVNSNRFDDHIYVYNILNELGIFANIEICDIESKQCFDSLDEEVLRFEKIFDGGPNKKAKLRACLKELLIEEKGKLLLKYPRKMATIHWTKK